MAGTARKSSPAARPKKRAPTRKQRAPTGPDLNDPSLYVNRELGLLSFQWRVLEEAFDATNPLLERANFLSIVGSNLNEFFMVRVASPPYRRSIAPTSSTSRFSLRRRLN
jgi:polyphosphate kinase